MTGADRDAGRQRGHAYVARGPRAVRRRLDAGLRAARPTARSRRWRPARGSRWRPTRRGPMDFVLWKPSKPGEPAWPSPGGIDDAGPARLAHRVLGDGGARIWATCSTSTAAASTSSSRTTRTRSRRSRCAHGTPVMANYWMHNGFLQVEGEKMSKSLGNFVTIHELLQRERSAISRGIRVSRLHARHALPAADRLDRREAACERASTLDRTLRRAGHVRCRRTARRMRRRACGALEDDLNTPAPLRSSTRSPKSASGAQLPAAAQPEVGRLSQFARACLLRIT